MIWWPSKVLKNLTTSSSTAEQKALNQYPNFIPDGKFGASNNNNYYTTGISTTSDLSFVISYNPTSQNNPDPIQLNPPVSGVYGLHFYKNINSTDYLIDWCATSDNKSITKTILHNADGFKPCLIDSMTGDTTLGTENIYYLWNAYSMLNGSYYSAVGLYTPYDTAWAVMDPTTLDFTLEPKGKEIHCALSSL